MIFVPMDSVIPFIFHRVSTTCVPVVKHMSNCWRTQGVYLDCSPILNKPSQPTSACLHIERKWHSVSQSSVYASKWQLLIWKLPNYTHCISIQRSRRGKCLSVTASQGTYSPAVYLSLLWIYRLPLQRGQRSETGGFEFLLKEWALCTPILDINATFTLSQTSAILAYLGPKLGLSGSDEMEQVKIHQLTLSALDMSSEAHNVSLTFSHYTCNSPKSWQIHHPISVALYYEDKKTEALRCAGDFHKSRIPKFLTHFEAVLAKNRTGVLVGSKVSMVDLTIFQVLEGLAFAYPLRMGTLRKNGSYTTLFALRVRDRVWKDLEGYPSIE